MDPVYISVVVIDGNHSGNLSQGIFYFPYLLIKVLNKGLKKHQWFSWIEIFAQMLHFAVSKAKGESHNLRNKLSAYFVDLPAFYTSEKFLT